MGGGGGGARNGKNYKIHTNRMNSVTLSSDLPFFMYLRLRNVSFKQASWGRMDGNEGASRPRTCGSKTRLGCEKPNYFQMNFSSIDPNCVHFPMESTTPNWHFLHSFCVVSARAHVRARYLAHRRPALVRESGERVSAPEPYRTIFLIRVPRCLHFHFARLLASHSLSTEHVR